MRPRTVIPFEKLRPVIRTGPSHRHFKRGALTWSCIETFVYNTRTRSVWMGAEIWSDTINGWQHEDESAMKICARCLGVSLRGRESCGGSAVKPHLQAAVSGIFRAKAFVTESADSRPKGG